MRLEFYDFQPISLNQWYSSSHWSKRSALKEEWSWRTREALQHCKQVKFDAPVAVRLTCWLKRPVDPDNSIVYVKLVLDSLREEGVLKDDTYKEIKSINLQVFKAKDNCVIMNIE